MIFKINVKQKIFSFIKLNKIDWYFNNKNFYDDKFHLNLYFRNLLI